jgi:hypothetical protein
MTRLMLKIKEPYLLEQGRLTLSLPHDYEPVRPAHFELSRICLAKGSLATSKRRRFEVLWQDS